MSAAEAIPGLLLGRDGEPVFDAPWQAQAFAMTVALHEKGVFTWSEWAATLGREIADGGHGDGNDGYYAAWLAALENIMAQKGVATVSELQDRRDAWRRAAEATPHGMPIELQTIES